MSALLPYVMKMKIKTVSCVFLCYTIVCCSGYPLDTAACGSPQYLILGKSENVECNFEGKFFGVLWYKEENFRKDDPLIRCLQDEKTGVGYETGEYDVHPNGSLFIRNVSLSDDTKFTVAFIEEETDKYEFITAEVVVIVRPAVPFPVIRSCGKFSNKCYVNRDVSIFQCSVKEVRPSVSLNFMVRTVEGDKDIPEEASFENGEYKALAYKREVFRYSFSLVLLVCKADAAPRMLDHYESLVLIQNTSIDISSREISRRNIELNKAIVLQCADSNAAFVVWKKQNSFQYNEYEDLLFSVNIEEGFQGTFSEYINVTERGNLIIPQVGVKHEGLYVCVSSDGLLDSTVGYDLNVIVHPVPAYPVITGCNQSLYCELEKKHHGSVACQVMGIRPQITLEWRILSSHYKHATIFTNHYHSVKDNGETYDVTLTSTYTIQDKSLDRLTVECRVVELNHNGFNLSKTVDLIFEQGEKKIPVTPTWVYPVLAILSGLTICVVLVYGISKCKRRQEKLQKQTTEELEACQSKSSGISEVTDRVKEKFLHQLRQKYRDQYEAVQPIPYIRDKMYCVEKVFVEGNLQFLEKASENEPRREWWRPLSSYQDIIKDDGIASERRILEGDPGFGKSTIMLQFAYDWCNSDQKSFLRHVEILIFLKLRQLRGVKSIYEAIRRFILPNDTSLSCEDIQMVVNGSHSVVILLDGYDEFPHQIDGIGADVERIIKRKFFQDFEVILTTRSSVLPNDYPAITKRIKLIGFDDESRKEYIRKAVVNNIETAQKVERCLRVNHILKDLCQVPLLFVIFAHLTYESTDFQNLNSATNFFRYMISTFHSHMRNKMKCENVLEYKLNEEDHAELDKIAFEALSAKDKKLVWDKDEICDKTGHEFYKQYKQIGILSEEKVVEFNDDSTLPISKHVHEKTEVQFYHKLFCEWYAAHYLVRLLKDPNTNPNKVMQNLDPFDLQYVFRFACGLNSECAKKVLDYINTIEGGDKLAILCILEQTGNFNNIKPSVTQLCEEGVILSGHDNLLLQRSTVQLIELATKNDIPIDYIDLDDCLESVDCSTGSITVTSKLSLTSSILVRTLRVSLYIRDMSEREALDILQFSSMCPDLKCLKFTGCIPSRSFDVGSAALKAIQAKNITVMWKMFEESEWLALDFQTGRWKKGDDGSQPTDEEFDFMKLQLEHQRKEWDESTLKEDVGRGREKLSERFQNNVVER